MRGMKIQPFNFLKCPHKDRILQSISSKDINEEQARLADSDDSIEKDIRLVISFSKPCADS